MTAPPAPAGRGGDAGARPRPRGAAVTPALVLAAHGTRSAEGERTLSGLAAAVRRARPGVRVELAYLEISAPPLPRVLAAADGPVVVVPLLLAGGYHVHVDLPAVVAEHRPGAVVAGQLGPHDLLTGALARRLESAGLRDGDAVVLGAAGSSDPSGLADVRAAARRLSVRLGRPVTAAFVSSGAPSLDEALERARRGPARRVAVASYLLAPGFFHGRLLASGADLVSAPLGADPGVVSLIWHRHETAVRAHPEAAVHAQYETAARAQSVGSEWGARTISPALAARPGAPYAPTNSPA